MRRAILTIDDSPTVHTGRILEHLERRNLRALFFCIGERLDRFPRIADAILQAGHSIGNHSWSHRRFSELDLRDCCAEIDQTEDAIEQAHRRNGLARRSRRFRFPYGDKGGPRKEAIQTEIALRGFSPIAGLDIDHPWFHEASLDRDRDVFWTFDCLDYRLTSGAPRLAPDDILAHMDDPAPPSGSSLASGASDEIILMHDNPNTHALFPDYHERLIDAILAKDIELAPP